MKTDPRYIKLKFGLSQLTNEELNRILNSPSDQMIYDDWNYEATTGRY